MVRNHQFGGAGAADGVFDEAAPPVRAGGMDALAAAVSQRSDQAAAVQLRQPAGQVAALDIPIVARHGPAGNQAEWNGLLVHEAAGGGVDGVLQVQQAQIVLAALANDDTAAALGRVGDQALQLAVDLPLEVPGEGADPDRALVLLGPDAGGRQVAQGLAGAGSGLGQHHVRIAADLPGGEGGAGRTGIIRLSRPLFGVRAQHGGEPGAGFGLRNRVRGGWRQRGGFLPLRQAFPDLEWFAGGSGVRPAKGMRDVSTPNPSRPSACGRLGWPRRGSSRCHGLEQAG